MMNLNLHVYLIGYTFAYGVLVAVLYDTLRTVIRRLKLEAKVKALFAVLFWLSVTVLSFWYFYVVSHGVFHFYLFVFVCLGIGLYVLFLRAGYLALLVHVLRIILGILRKIRRLMEKYLFSPILFLFKKMSAIMERHSDD